jgi:hypothetical protein
MGAYLSSSSVTDQHELEGCDSLRHSRGILVVGLYELIERHRLAELLPLERDSSRQDALRQKRKVVEEEG